MALTKIPGFGIDTASFALPIANITGNLTAGNANLGNSVTANFFIGNGSLLTGLPAGYANSNVASYLPTFTGNITAGNANLGNITTSNYFSGNGSLLISITGANITGNAPYASTSNYANTANSITGNNVSGNVNYAITSNWANVANSVTGTNVSGNVNYAITANYANTANAIAGANVTGYVPNANIANTAYAVAVANVTGIGNIATINKDGNTSNILYGNGVFSSIPADSGAYSAIASGSITAGSPVVINSNGTVSITGAQQVGPNTAVRFDTNYATLGAGTSSVYDPVNNKILTFYSYQNGSFYSPGVVVGTVSGDTITWAYNYSFNNSQYILTTYVYATYDPVNQKSVLFYVDRTSNNVQCQLVTINNISGYPTFSSPVTVATNATIGSCDYDSVSGKIVVAIYDNSSSSGYAYVGTISGDSISFGTGVVYITGGVPAPIESSLLKCGNGKVVIAYGQYYSRYVKAGTISGTSISFGTGVSIDGNQGTLRSLDYSSSDDTFIVTVTGSGSMATAFTVSGTTITLGTPFQLDSNSDGAYVKYSPALKKFTIFKGLTARVVTLSGTTITTGSNITLLATIGSNTPPPTIVYHSANSVYVMIGINNTIGTGASGYAYVFHPGYTSLTSTNYIGMSSGTYSSGATATIQLAGSTNTSQTGLTAGQSYYVQPYGTLSTTPGTPSVFAGTAVSATKIIIQNTTLNANLSATYLTGTLTTIAQPNITSLGTLTGLTVSGDTTLTGNLTVSGAFEYANVTSFRVKDPIIEQGGNTTGGALTSNDGFDRGQLLHYYSGSSAVDAFMGYKNSSGEFIFGSNVTVSSEVVTVNTYGNIHAGNANLGNIAISNYFSGNGSLLTSITGANVTGTVSSATTASTVTTNAQPNITSVGTLTSLIVTGNTTTGNLTGANLVSANYITGTLTTAAQPNITSVGTLLNTTLGASNSFTGGNLVSATYLTGTLTTAAQPNITSTGTLTSLIVGNATANTTFGNGTITLTTAGTINAGNLLTTNNLSVTTYVTSNLVPNANITYSLGTTTNRWKDLWLAGNTIYLADGTVSAGTVALGNSNISIPVSNGNVIISAVGNSNIVVVTGTGVNIAGTLDTGSGIIKTTGNANVGNLVFGSGIITGTGNITGGNIIGTIAAGSNTITTTGNITGGNIIGIIAAGSNTITTTGNVTGGNIIGTIAAGSNTITTTGNSTVGNLIFGSGVITGTGNIISGNADLGNAVTANFFIGSGNNLSNIQAANISGAVPFAASAGFVTTASQPNIVTLGTLTGITSVGNVNFSTTNNISLGSISNIHITGGTSGYVLQTDGSGNLSWTAQTGSGGGGGSGSAISSGTSNVDIPASSGNINFSANGNPRVVVITDTGANINGYANITGNLEASGPNVSLGTVANLKIAGGTPGQVLSTDGSGNLTWKTAGSGPGGTGFLWIYTRSQINVTVNVISRYVNIVGRSGTKPIVVS